mmetsp:Transcript_44863/g.80773  ORF Transcript_44863/g.80773 Transcript_44863/m.80773 type:complete len:266 (-) Transcript_44863:96-893(-)
MSVACKTPTSDTMRADRLRLGGLAQVSGSRCPAFSTDASVLGISGSGCPAFSSCASVAGKSVVSSIAASGAKSGSRVRRLAAASLGLPPVSEAAAEHVAHLFGGAAGAPRSGHEAAPNKLRTYPRGPNQQSVVDQIVLGRDVDFSGEDQYDEEHYRMFRGAGGMSNKEADARKGWKGHHKGLRIQPDAHNKKSEVGSIIFNKHAETSGVDASCSPHQQLFDGAGGRSSKEVVDAARLRQRGLRSCEDRRRRSTDLKKVIYGSGAS